MDDEQTGHFDPATCLCVAGSVAPSSVALCERCEALVKSGRSHGRLPQWMIPIATHRMECWSCHPPRKGPDVSRAKFSLAHRDLGYRVTHAPRRDGGGEYAPVEPHLVPVA